MTVSPCGEGNLLGELELLWGEGRTGEKHLKPFPRALWQSGRMFFRGFIKIIAKRSGLLPNPHKQLSLRGLSYLERRARKSDICNVMKEWDCLCLVEIKINE